MAASSSSSRGGGGGDDDNEPYLVGFVVSKIVGLKHYSGTLSGGERPSLVREPLNRFDTNAIAVHNSRGLQVGHIEGRTAKVLAPLLDCLLVANPHVLVPGSRSSKAGTNFYNLPCQIHLFARPAAAAIGRGLCPTASSGGGEGRSTEEEAGGGDRGRRPCRPWVKASWTAPALRENPRPAASARTITCTRRGSHGMVGWCGSVAREAKHFTLINSVARDMGKLTMVSMRLIVPLLFGKADHSSSRRRVGRSRPLHGA